MKLNNIFSKNIAQKVSKTNCKYDFNKYPSETKSNSTKKSHKHSFLSNIFFTWVFPVMMTANKRQIDENDLVETSERYDSGKLGDVLEKFWFEEINISKRNNKKPSLVKVMWRTFGIEFIPSGVLVLTLCFFRMATPVVFTGLIRYWTANSDMTKNEAIYFSIGLLLLVILSSFFQHLSNMDIYNFGMKLRVACSSLIYRKLLRMNQASLNEVAAGKLVNLMSNDIAKFDQAFLFLHYLWTIPIQVAIVLYLLYNLGGYPPIAGLVVMILFVIPSQALLTRLMAIARKKLAQQSDARIKLMNEIINGIHVIKMYAWEKPFLAITQRIRKNEIKYQKYCHYIFCTFVGMIQYADRMSLYITMIIMYYSGSLAAATKVFPIQQYFAIFQMSLTVNMPLAISNYTELLVSLERIQEALLMTEINKHCEGEKQVATKAVYSKNNYTFSSGKDQLKPKYYKQDSNVAVELIDICASWDPSNCPEVLKDIKLTFESSKLSIIIGTVGSGKSSLFHVILNELMPIKGNVILNGKISYASQEPWLFSDTVRENILFGSPFEAKKYYEVCRVCCLNPDFNQFSNGDLTLVGERGVTLSGGQKARVNLARAIYKEADIYLLDDPLSAVDTHVAKMIFEDCINGYLKNKTRILITHQIHFIKVADLIVVMNEGKVLNKGNYNNLMTSQSLSALLSNNEESIESDKNNQLNELNKLDKKDNNADEINQILQINSNKVDKEFRATGNLSFSVYTRYLSSVNSCCISCFAFGLIILSQGFGTVCDYAFSLWTNEVEQYEKSFKGQDISFPDIHTTLNIVSTEQLFISFGALLLIQMVMTYVRTVPFAIMVTKASSNIHDKMFRNLSRAKMMLFDTSPPGRILNRFSKDLGMMDDLMPKSFLPMSQIFLQIVSALIINAFSLTWTLIPTAGLIIIFFVIMKCNMPVTQSVKRLENTTKSPVLGKINTTFSGLTTIRSNKAEKQLLKQFDETQNIHSNAFYTYCGCSEALALYLDFLSIIYLTIVLCIFLFTDIGLALEASFIGVAIGQIMVLMQKLQVAAKFTTDFLGQMTSVERTLEYTEIPVEDDITTELCPVPDNWPSKGSLSFKNLSLSYNNTKVLKNLSFDIQSGWKIGVVGRTGAGKSSMISALFRLYDTEGSIAVDGIETSLISKEVLRSKISIIPQEPVLFSASLRYNLDPFNVYNDDSIWRALEQVELKDAVTSLDYTISEGGSNFSVGQRQLICLARAILRSNKILVMDEATANVDPQTDALIQQTIRQKFSHCTVITIAHRLNTIMDSDRVLVLEQGQLVEYDHPYILLTNKDSLFYGMVQKTGTTMTKNLLKIASDNYHEI